jgi:hypothetical protein
VQKDTTSEENFAHRWAIVWRPSSCPLMIPNHRNQEHPLIAIMRVIEDHLRPGGPHNA